LFTPPSGGGPYKTWYKIFGVVGARRPLIALHGGPGVPHNYLLNLADINARYGVPVVFYDQVGSGRSQHLPDKKGDTEFWSEALFIAQLENLVVRLGIQDGYDLLGHSWGGMLAARYASTERTGLKHLILWSAPADMRSYVDAQLSLCRQLPEDVQVPLIEHEETDPPKVTPEYRKSASIFYSKFQCRLDPRPAQLEEAIALAGVASATSANATMHGRYFMKVVGTLRNWSMVEDAHKINVPTLLLNGRYDQAQDSAVKPYFERIPRVKWVQFNESSHTAHFEEHERFIEVVGEFLVE